MKAPSLCRLTCHSSHLQHIFLLSTALTCCNKTQDTKTSSAALPEPDAVTMFAPEPSDSRLSLAQGTESRDPDALAIKIGFALTHLAGQRNFVVVTADNEQLLVTEMGLSYPIPVAGLDAKGDVFLYYAPTTPLRGGGALVANIYMRVKAGEPARVTRAADGSASNLYKLWLVHSGSTAPEPYLISTKYEVQSSGGRSLLRIGNDLVDGKAGVSLLHFNEIGNQVWQARGTFANAYFTWGSVVWSPDLRSFYSQRTSNDPVMEWKTQNDALMALVGPASKEVAVPKIIGKLLVRTPTDAERESQLFLGVPVLTVSRGATSLYNDGSIQGANLTNESVVGSAAGPRRVAPPSGDAMEHFYDTLGLASDPGFGLETKEPYDSPNATLLRNGDQHAKIGGLFKAYTPEGDVVQGRLMFASVGNQQGNVRGQTVPVTTSYLDAGNGTYFKVDSPVGGGDRSTAITQNRGDVLNQLRAQNTPEALATIKELTAQYQEQTNAGIEKAGVSEKAGAEFQKYGTVAGIGNVVKDVGVDIVADKLGGGLGNKTAGQFVDKGLTGAAKIAAEEKGAEVIKTLVETTVKAAANAPENVAAKNNGENAKLITSGLGFSGTIATAGLGNPKVTGAVKATAGLVDAIRGGSEGGGFGEKITGSAQGLSDIVGVAVPIPGAGVAARIALEGTGAIASSFETKNAFNAAIATGDRITGITVARNTLDNLAKATENFPKPNEQSLVPETRPAAENRPAENRPGESLPAENRPAENKPADVGPLGETKAPEGSLNEAKPKEGETKVPELGTAETPTDKPKEDPNAIDFRDPNVKVPE